MIKYLDYIEATEAHILHPEELSTRGIKELRDAIKIFQALRDEFVKIPSHSISTKWDGAPAIVCGINPDNKKFFVSTKAALATEPRVCYTIQDIKKYFENIELQAKLMAALQYLPNLKITGIMQGDLLFTMGSKKHETIDDKEHIVFRANTITYAVEANSEVGEQINRAKIGIVFHTRYVGSPGKLVKSALSANEVPESTTDVWSISPYINKDVPAILSQEDKTKVTENLREIGSLFHKLNQEFYAKMNEFKIKDSLERVMNSYIKKESLPQDVNKFITEIVEAALSLSKKKSAQANEFLNEYKEQFEALFKIYKLLYDTKIIFVRALEKVKNDVKTFVQDDKGFQVTTPEGFVLASTTGKMVKLVDRLNFSKNNFNFVKNWGQE